VSFNDDDFAELFKKLPSKSSGGTTWQDVAAELGALGKSFGDILRNTLQGQDSEAGLSQLRTSLEAMVQDLNRAIDGTPEAEQARDQLVNLTESIRKAVGQASEDLRPELLAMLRQANAELRRLTRLDE
jgi:hypothetical protein